MLRDPPEINVVPGHLLEHAGKGLKRPEERVVHEDHLVVGREGLKAQMENAVPVAPEVEPDVRPDEDLVRVLPKSRAALLIHIPVHDREDRRSAYPEILQHAEYVAIRDPVLVEEQKYDQAVFCFSVNDHDASLKPSGQECLTRSRNSGNGRYPPVLSASAFMSVRFM